MTDERPRASLAVRLAIAAGAVVVYFVGMQLVRPLFEHDPTQPDRTPNYVGIDRPSDDPLLRLELIPGANGVVNGDGYVGTRYPIEREPGVFRVIGLGDSITMYYSAERQNYLYLAEQILNERGGPPVQILNFGVHSYTTTNEVRQLELRGLAYRPDLVTVGYCLNDGVDFVFSVNAATGRLGVPEREHSVLDVVGRIQRMVASPSATLAPEDFFASHVLPSIAWTESMAALERLAALAAEHGFDVVVIVFPVLLDFDRYAFAPVHDALAAKARELELGFIDLLPEYQRHAAAIREDPRGDVIHPNPTGHEVAARVLAQYVIARGHLERPSDR